MVARSMLIAIVAVVVAVAIVATAVTVLFLLPRGPTVELWFNNSGHYGDTEPNVALVLKGQLEKAGVFSVTLKSSAWPQYTDQFARGELPMFLLGWFPDYPDSDDYFSPFMTRGGAASLGSFYNNSVAERLVANESTLPPDQREPVFFALQDLLASDVPYVPLWQTGANAVQEVDVTNVILDPFLFRYYLIGKPGATSFFMSTTDSVTDLDPAIEYDLFSGTVVGNIFDTLYMTTPTNGTTPAEIVPLLADGNMTNPGGDTSKWLVKLKPGLKFSNGDPITAQDIVFSFKRMIVQNNPGSPAFLYKGIIDTANVDNLITCPDGPCDQTLSVLFQLNKSYTIFPGLLTFSGSAILNHNVFNNDVQAKITGINVPAGAGSGPYVIGPGSDKNTKIVLVKNNNYNFATGFWDRYVSVTTVPVMPEFNINLKTSATALRQDIEAHTTTGVNLVYRSLNPPDVKALQSKTDLRVLLGASPQIRYLVFNVQKPPFNDVNLRRAIAYLVDRQEIVDTVFQGLAQPLWSMLPPGWLGHKDVFKEVYGDRPNIDKAKQLLQSVKLGIEPADYIARSTEE